MGKFCRNGGQVLCQRFRLFIQDGIHHCRLVLTSEGEMARQHLKQHNTEGEDIRTGIDLASFDLLWSHICEGSHSSGSARQLQRALQLGQSEVHHLNLVVGVQHDVVGLDVAVHDASAVCCTECFTNLNSVGDCIVDFLDRQDLSQRSALDEFHDDELLTAVFRDVVNDAHVRMVQGRGGLGLLHESCPLGFVDLFLTREKFQCNETFELRVLGLVHYTHAALGELFEDLVMRNDLADHKGLLWWE